MQTLIDFLEEVQLRWFVYSRLLAQVYIHRTEFTQGLLYGKKYERLRRKNAAVGVEPSTVEQLFLEF